MSSLAQTTYETTTEDIVAGDIVAIRHGATGRTEGLVVGSHIDFRGRQIIEVQLDNNVIHRVHYPEVARVRRTIAYSLPSPHKARTIERRVYW